MSILDGLLDFFGIGPTAEKLRQDGRILQAAKRLKRLDDNRKVWSAAPLDVWIYRIDTLVNSYPWPNVQQVEENLRNSLALGRWDYGVENA